MALGIILGAVAEERDSGEGEEEWFHGSNAEAGAGHFWAAKFYHEMIVLVTLYVGTLFSL